MKKVYIKMCVNKIYKKLRCFLEKKYKADKKFTQPPVATVATNFKSVMREREFTIIVIDVLT